ncbi:hypothetical protein S58_16440 [Bradyrhizobium oligotrophicum S58]|uniref:Uncharacterized protein n=1 Tax=Bradyrhizobium oligotrophicum S58 TaxID=1245469 RepID=M4Z418_9BRAD|nr:hypothetical protein S58_16440 [Bradyrhizobium oligotrophicum S58]
MKIVVTVWDDDGVFDVLKEIVPNAVLYVAVTADEKSERAVDPDIIKLVAR